MKKTRKQKRITLEQLSPASVDSVMKIVNAFKEGRDFSDYNALGVDWDAIYDLDDLLEDCRVKRIPVDSRVLLARLLMKYEFSRFNAEPGYERLVTSYSAAPTDLLICNFHIPTLTKLMSEHELDDWNAEAFKSSIAARLRRTVIEELHDQPYMVNDQDFRTILAPFVHRLVNLSSHAKAQIRDVAISLGYRSM